MQFNVGGPSRLAASIHTHTHAYYISKRTTNSVMSVFIVVSMLNSVVVFVVDVIPSCGPDVIQCVYVCMCVCRVCFRHMAVAHLGLASPSLYMSLNVSSSVVAMQSRVLSMLSAHDVVLHYFYYY